MKLQSLVGPKVVCGWSIQHNKEAPITARWQAEQDGVTMCSGDYEALEHMIKVRLITI